MREIQLTKGQTTIVDDEDYESLIKFKWHAYWNPSSKTFYANRMSSSNPGPRGIIRMHRVIMNCPNGMYIDHINKNTLDNRKENLRICNKSQNAGNSKLRVDNKTGYKGIRYVQKMNRWVVYMTQNGNYIHIGTYKSKIEAALAYDDAASDHFGEFARLNFPEYK